MNKEYKSLKKRLKRTLVMSSLLPIFTIGLLCALVSTLSLRNMSKDNVATKVSIISSECEGLFSQALELGQMIEANSSIHYIIDQNPVADIKLKYSNQLFADTTLYSIQQFRKQIFGFYIVDHTGAAYKSTYRSIRDDIDFCSTDWYKRIIESDEPVWFAPHIGSFVVQTVNERNNFV